ncbi:MAG TPA: hypothetical protein VL326_28355 [Kofleriaceae bacterium]|jgi:hypothetical protein|nr:hypothetical protein [Kofleriaceae bacterium]
MEPKRSLFLLVVTFAGALAACTADVSIKSQAEKNLPGSCTANAPDPRACDPADTKKTTICHIPPGNPANAHTICVGNAAVPAHLEHHGDFVGTCSCGGGDGGGDGSGTGGDGSGTGGDGSGDGSGGGGGGTGGGGGSGTGDGGGGGLY